MGPGAAAGPSGELKPLQLSDCLPVRPAENPTNLYINRSLVSEGKGFPAVTLPPYSVFMTLRWHCRRAVKKRGCICPEADRARTGVLLSGVETGWLSFSFFSYHPPSQSWGTAVGFVVNLSLDSSYKKH